MSKGTFRKAGGFLSITCAIWCLASPVILMFLPALKLSERAEFIMVIASVLIGVSSAINGWFEHHKSSILVYVGFASALLLIARLSVLARWETTLLVAGALFMAGAQFLNIRYEKMYCTDHDELEEAASA